MAFVTYFQILFGYEWELTTSPAGAKQWVAKDADLIIPDAFDKSKKQKQFFNLFCSKTIKF